MTWDDKKVAELIRLFPTHTYTEIGMKLGCTRKVVSGKVHRLGLKRSEETRKQHQVRNGYEFSRAPVVKPLGRQLAGLNNQVVRRDPKPLPVSKAPRFEGQSISIMALTLTTCRFIVSGSGMDAGYCGHEVETGSYCRGHARLCLAPPAPKIKVPKGTYG